MAGRRPLTPSEQRMLLRALRDSSTRDRALVTVQWLSGARLSEVLALKVGDVCRPSGELVQKIGFRPQYLKGHYGSTRWVPVSPEMQRALTSYLGWLRQRWELSPKLPLFLSRQEFPGGEDRPITREAARLIVRGAFSRAGILDDGRLGSHSLRKAWAQSAYEASGKDILVVKACLGHADVGTTQAYLSPSDSAVEAAMRAADFTRPSRRERVAPAERKAAPKDLFAPRSKLDAGRPVPPANSAPVAISTTPAKIQETMVGQGTSSPGAIAAALPPAA